MQALNDSGLGEALIGGGLQDELRQPVFSIGLKGVDPANADKARPRLSLSPPARPLGHCSVCCCQSQPPCKPGRVHVGGHVTQGSAKPMAGS